MGRRLAEERERERKRERERREREESGERGRESIVQGGAGCINPLLPSLSQLSLQIQETWERGREGERERALRTEVRAVSTPSRRI